MSELNEFSRAELLLGKKGIEKLRKARVAVFGIGGVQLKSRYRNVAEIYTSEVDKHGNSIQGDFTTLTDTDSQQVGNMALGGFENGVTTLEMAAAYSAFVNDGIYTTPRTYSRVEDSKGNVIIDNNTESHVAMKKTTAYLMRSILQDVVRRGSGGGAYFSGMSIGGKTGTTDDARDRYFAGFTPYYCAAAWSGYKSNEVVYSDTNPCSAMFKRVMSRIHEGLEDPGFHSCDGLVNVTVCADSGLLATEACAADFRGSRVKTVQVAADTAPTQSCTMHKMVSYCKDGKIDLCAECNPLHGPRVRALIEQLARGETPEKLSYMPEALFTADTLTAELLESRVY